MSMMKYVSMCLALLFAETMINASFAVYLFSSVAAKFVRLDAPCALLAARRGRDKAAEDANALGVSVLAS